MKRFLSGPLHGTALGLYFLLLPYVVLAKWRASASRADSAPVHVLLVSLGALWVIFLVQLVRQVVRLRRGESVGSGGSAWLAGVLVALASLSLLAPGGALSSRPSAPSVSLSARAGLSATSSRARPEPTRHATPGPPGPGALVLAMSAKRRRDSLRRAAPDDEDVDTALAQLRQGDVALLGQLNFLLAGSRDGVVRLSGAFADSPLDTQTPLALIVLGHDARSVTVAFAREGGTLRVPPETSTADLAAEVVLAHAGGDLRVTVCESELLRALATRSPLTSVVLYDGERTDDELMTRAVRVVRSARPRARELSLTPVPATTRDACRVQLLRAEPRLSGLVEELAAPLRRRAIEMAAYLAVHRLEPVTGDRLRSRVLAHADVDASVRTLANTATTLRRALGVDDAGARLHPVSSAGLYETHGLDSDVEQFHALVRSARSGGGTRALRDALALVRGEPLAGVLRGYEWFLAEGHVARLAREGEWAALALSRWAADEGDVELAFWAIEQGRLLDPYSDELSAALAEVPRLREFGRDRAGTAQHESVGAGGAVVTSRSGERLVD